MMNAGVSAGMAPAHISTRSQKDKMTRFGKLTGVSHKKSNKFQTQWGSSFNGYARLFFFFSKQIPESLGRTLMAAVCRLLIINGVYVENQTSEITLCLRINRRRTDFP